MRLPIIQTIPSDDFEQFIDHWSNIYESNLDSSYWEHIKLTNYEEDINALFEWKNGMVLSERKKNTLQKKVLSKLDFIKALKKSDSIQLEDFLNEFKNLSAVWKIFLLHIIKPELYPIYDQHIHRAYNFIHGLEYNNISASSFKDKDKLDFYFTSYLKFIEKNRKVNLKRLDEALYTFGKFLRTSNYSEIVNQKSF